MIIAFVKWEETTLVDWGDKSVPRVGDYVMMPRDHGDYQVKKVIWYAGESDGGDWDVMIKLE